MGFPNEKELARVRKKLADTEGTLLIPDDAEPKDVLRWNICQEFVKYSNDNDLTNSEFANELNIDRGDINKILNHRIDRFSTDRLLDLLAVFCSNHEILLKVS